MKDQNDGIPLIYIRFGKFQVLDPKVQMKTAKRYLHSYLYLLLPLLPLVIESALSSEKRFNFPKPITMFFFAILFIKGRNFVRKFAISKREFKKKQKNNCVMGDRERGGDSIKGLFMKFLKFHSRFSWGWGYLTYRSYVKWHTM